MGIVDRALARLLGPERLLPRWVDDLLEETFLCVAAGHLLMSLGVPAEQVRRLGVLQEHLEEARRAAAAAGSPLPIAALRVPAVQRRALDRSHASLRANWMPPAERRRLAEEAAERREEAARRAEEEQARRRAAPAGGRRGLSRWAASTVVGAYLVGVLVLALGKLVLLVAGTRASVARRDTPVPPTA